MGRKQVSTRVTEEKKGRWADYAEETHGSMTALIRQAVDAYVDNDIARNPEGWAESDGQSGSSPEMVQEVSAAIDSLENTVNDMDGRLRAVRESVQSGGPDYSFRAAVRETVPVAESGPDGDYYAEYGRSVTEIAARLNADESDVRDALGELETNGEVTSATGGSAQETVYVRTEGV